MPLEKVVFSQEGNITYTEIRTFDRRLTLSCYGDDNVTSITLRQAGGQVLNQTTSNLLTYKLGSLQCEHMDAYFCDKYYIEGKHYCSSKRL